MNKNLVLKFYKWIIFTIYFVFRFLCVVLTNFYVMPIVFCFLQLVNVYSAYPKNLNLGFLCSINERKINIYF